MQRVILLLSALALAAAQAQSPQIITNSSFEELGLRGFPADWERVGAEASVTDDAHSGKRALRFVRPVDAKRETGLNREWKAHSGEQGKMLDVLKGGIRFWYKARSADDCRMFVYLIPMNEEPLEGTGSQRAMFEVPATHVGDGKWHEGALRYDFTDNDKVKWVHVSVRLRGGPGEMLFDDVTWVEKVGPQMQLVKPRIWEIKSSGGRQCLVV